MDLYGTPGMRLSLDMPICLSACDGKARPLR
jgi:hypothetical protein